MLSPTQKFHKRFKELTAQIKQLEGTIQMTNALMRELYDSNSQNRERIKQLKEKRRQLLMSFTKER